MSKSNSNNSNNPNNSSIITKSVFVIKYSWEDIDNNTIIHIYALDDDNKNVYIRIEDFMTYCYVELPEVVNNKVIDWKQHVSSLITKINTMGNPSYRPLVKKLEYKKRFYGAFKDLNPKYGKEGNELKYINKLFPFLYMSFQSVRAMSSFKNLLEKENYIHPFGKLKLKVHEGDWGTTPYLKLRVRNSLPSMGWIKIRGQINTEKYSTCHYEYIVSYKNIEADLTNTKIIYPKIMTIDTEENSSNWKYNALPDYDKPEDKVFQISVVISRNTTYNPDKNKYDKYLLSLGNPDPIDGVTILKFKSEIKLLLGLKDFILKAKPNIILGYNLFGWDLKYMLSRAKYLDIFTQFITNGFINGKASNVPKEKKMAESKAFGKIQKSPIETDGIIYIDLYPIATMKFKLVDYKLNTVAEKCKVGEKDPLTAQDIFRCYREFTGKSLALVGKYCVQDSFVTICIFEKLNIWPGIYAEAKTNHVPSSYLFTRGQQVKMYNQVYDFNSNTNMIVEKNPFDKNSNEHYTGAIVLEAKKGKHIDVISEDFASLYPSIMIAYNIDYSTYVCDDNIPDEDCYVFEWEEHTNCEHDTEFIMEEKKKNDRKKRIEENKKKREEKKEKKKGVKITEDYIRIMEKKKGKSAHILMIEEEFELKKEKIKKDIDLNLVKLDFDTERDKEENIKVTKKPKICTKFRYRFLKENLGGKGVIPTLIEKLLDARKKTRLKIAELEKKRDEEKLSKIDLENLEMEIMVLDKQQLEYKVSANSMYGAMGVSEGYLPFLPGAMCVTYMGRKSIARAKKLIEDKGGEVIYGDTDSCMAKFAGKNYSELFTIGKEISEESKKIFKFPMKLDFEGVIYRIFVLLTKKRYAAQACDVNGNVKPDLIVKGVQLKRRDGCKIMRDMYKYCLESTFSNIPEDIMINKIVNDVINCFNRTYPNSSFVITKTLKRMPNEYKVKPPLAHLAQKMINRGVHPGVNSRIGYIFTTEGGNKYNVKQQAKIEEEEYFDNWKTIYRIDYLYCLEKQLVKPITQLLEVIAPKYADIMTKLFTYHKNKELMVKSLYKFFNPIIEFDMRNYNDNCDIQFQE